MLINKTKAGFTLIELLVVIAIIGILAAIGVSSFGTSQIKARDAKRAADLHQMITALALYADRNKEAYPIVTTATVASSSSVLVNALSTVSYSVPKTPKGAGTVNDYWYISNASGSIAAVFTNNEKGSTWRVNNTKGFSGDITAGEDGSSPTIPSDPSQTVCSSTNSGVTGSQYQPCMSQPVIVENGGGGDVCTPAWTCDVWSPCCENSQSRTCTDSNNCGVTTGKPVEVQYCPNSRICV
jgi:prepilin-type N-terminal cleavage/methylation domain-containing protein